MHLEVALRVRSQSVVSHSTTLHEPFLRLKARGFHHTKAPLPYRFDHFTFVSREIKQGNRLRLTLSPVNSIYSEKNYNSGGEVAAESLQDAHTVTVMLYHDRAHPSILYVPLGAPQSAGEPTAPASAFEASP